MSGFGITSGYFETLGLKPEIGREFDRMAEIPANRMQVILSDRPLALTFCGRSRSAGTQDHPRYEPYTIVGVMPAGTEHPGNSYRSVAYGDSVDEWRPFPFSKDSSQRGSHFLDAIGRLKPGVTPEQAKAELNSIMTQMGREHGDDQGWSVLVNPLSEEIVGSNRHMLWVLLGAVGMVLMIASANAANLLLARAASRQREVAVRLALGAPRARLMRQMLTESLLISLLGGSIGLVLAVGGVKALVTLLPEGFPRAHEIEVNPQVFAFTLVVSIAVGLLFGLGTCISSFAHGPAARFSGCRAQRYGRRPAQAFEEPVSSFGDLPGVHLADWGSPDAKVFFKSTGAESGLPAPACANCQHLASSGYLSRPKGPW